MFRGWINKSRGFQWIIIIHKFYANENFIYNSKYRDNNQYIWSIIISYVYSKFYQERSTSYMMVMESTTCLILVKIYMNRTIQLNNQQQLQKEEAKLIVLESASKYFQKCSIDEGLFREIDKCF
ncbi:hypothetical protein pb186bvf_020645 [Paramecium bursaria]